ncbi:uncharacterized protein LOC133177301 [Saccostrea echinata]|uniref:uncharacterized protein LOC133177301 n=1 Tax=Saccostrea echinata TaxID=191078 RepID=UPI002A819C93|nr:uncharacterized protein LOC133177301 [Saccostrea echinata]
MPQQYVPLHDSNVSTFGTCEISILTLRFVENCPDDEEAWLRAAEKLDCASITQSCAESIGSPYNTQNYVFQYHCVINSYCNATMEVCALNRTILGFCAEFNIHGAVIQDNYDADCTQHTPPCPTSYNSAEAYKYPSCYEMAKRNRKTNTKTIDNNFHPSSSSR